MNQEEKIQEILSLTGFVLTRMELDGVSTRRLSLAYFYAFFCPAFRDAVVMVRETLWAQRIAPFPFDPHSPEREWWHPPSPFLTHLIPGDTVRWILGEDLPGGASETAPHYREFMKPWVEKPKWYDALRPEIRKLLEDRFDETYLAVPWASNSNSDGGLRGGKLFDHTWLLEFARSNIPPLATEYQDYSITWGALFGPDMEYQDHRIEVRLYSRSLKAVEVAQEYGRLLALWANDHRMRLFDKWPGGTAKRGGPIRFSEITNDRHWIIPSVSFNAFPPWPSVAMVEAFVTEAIAVSADTLSEKQSSADTSNWVRALTTTTLVSWGGLSARQAISSWNAWAPTIKTFEGQGIPIWSRIEDFTSPSEAYFSRERQKVLATMRHYRGLGLCDAES
jgi:hypothetical protein